MDALTDGEAGVGARRRCHFENGGSVVEEVTTWELNRSYQVRLTEMAAMPLDEARVNVSVEPLETGRTTVRWGMDYRVKYGPVGWILGHSMMKAMMRGVLDGNLQGLANRVRSGLH